MQDCCCHSPLPCCSIYCYSHAAPLASSLLAAPRHLLATSSPPPRLHLTSTSPPPRLHLTSTSPADPPPLASSFSTPAACLTPTRLLPLYRAPTRCTTTCSAAASNTFVRTGGLRPCSLVGSAASLQTSDSCRGAELRGRLRVRRYVCVSFLYTYGFVGEEENDGWCRHGQWHAWAVPATERVLIIIVW